jgi:predicted RNA-binding protein with PIN domain
MAVLVDGYNLAWVMRGLEGRAGDPFDPAAEARRLADFLGRYAEAADERVVVVFDGNCPPPLEKGATPRRVKVVYSGKARKADDVLVEMAGEQGPGAGAIVVSSDREVRARTHETPAESMTSDQFRSHAIETINRAEDRVRNAEPDAKTRGLRPGEVDVWMDILGLDSDTDRGK